MSHSNVEKGILRYGWWSRTNHWLISICFVLLTLSGLAMFHPVFFNLTGLFMSPIATRIVHPFIGVFMSCFFAIQAVRFFRANLLRRYDWQWVRQIGDVLSNRDDRLPPVGQNNPGQKAVYWLFLATVPVLLVTGVIIWRPYFADEMPRQLLRWSVLIHAYAAFIAIITLIIHVYSAIWVKGSIRAMTQGRVSRAWARHHHALWYEEIQRNERQGDDTREPVQTKETRP